MKLGLELKVGLTQTLTPQQIQYLKLLQLPVLQLEQHVIHELEQNPMLEEADAEMITDEGMDFVDDDQDYAPTAIIDKDITDEHTDVHDDFLESRTYIDDDPEPFEFYKMIAQNESEYSRDTSNYVDEEESESFQIRDEISFFDDLIQQLRMLPLSDEEYLLGEQIVGNVDDDGYLRRELNEIVEETNILIAELNLDNQRKEEKLERESRGESYNPARNYAVSEEVMRILSNYHTDLTNDRVEADNRNARLSEVTLEQAEKVLKLIQNLEPPGIASRTVQECLVSQCKALPKKNAVQKLALEILENAYEAFTMKHFHIIKKRFEVSEDYIREAFDLIRRLNPKPGGSSNDIISQSIYPDFIIEKTLDNKDLLITVNDSKLPVIKLSDAYTKIRKESKYKLFNKETKEWIKSKYEDAKFLIQAIRQRKNTMLKVMTAIAGLQRDFFDIGPAGLKPLIYKDVAEATGLDISTVCRIVNGKYAQTEFGTIELKSFFSEALPNEDGEDVATAVIKQALKTIIDEEPKNKPFSDDKLTVELKKKGYIVARRTITKYREQLKIPVARLRREL